MKTFAFTIFIAIACILGTIKAADNNLDWIAQFSAEDKSSTFKGSVKFNWTGGHNVYELASKEAYENCDFTGATNKGDTTGVTVSGNSGDVKYYSCSIVSTQGNHCKSGQKIAITFEAAAINTNTNTNTNTFTNTLIDTAKIIDTIGAYNLQVTAAIILAFVALF